MSDPIRVGLIRCDTHGAYYAALCARKGNRLYVTIKIFVYA